MFDGSEVREILTECMTQTLALQGVIVPSVVYGAGRHIQYIDPDDAKLGLKLNFVSQGLCLWPIAVVKVSVGFFLLRIAVQQAYRRTIYGIMSESSLQNNSSYLLLISCGLYG